MMHLKEMVWIIDGLIEYDTPTDAVELKKNSRNQMDI